MSTLVGTELDSTVASDLILPELSGGSVSASTLAGAGDESSESAPTVSYDEMMDAQQQIVDALESEMMETNDDSVFMALRTAATAVSRDLSERSQSQARLYDYEAGAVMPSCVTAMDLYGDAGRAREIVVRNGVRHPLFCPNVLKVLNE